MNLIIDIGNTRTKLALFKNGQLVKLEIQENKKIENIDGSINIESLVESVKTDCIIVSSVKNIVVNEAIKASVLVLDSNTKLPIINTYKSTTLGVDRIAFAVGAFSLFPKKNSLLIDLGSAITIDFINSKGVYEGGNISPGMFYRFKSLNNFTSKLPLVSHEGSYLLTSKTTEDAIRSGVVNSILFEIESYIVNYKKKYNDIEIILTGGDSKFFAKQLKKRIFAKEKSIDLLGGDKKAQNVNLNDSKIEIDKDLVLKGLNTILEYNVNKI